MSKSHPSTGPYHTNSRHFWTSDGPFFFNSHSHTPSQAFPGQAAPRPLGAKRVLGGPAVPPELQPWDQQSKHGCGACWDKAAESAGQRKSLRSPQIFCSWTVTGGQIPNTLSSPLAFLPPPCLLFSNPLHIAQAVREAPEVLKMWPGGETHTESSLSRGAWIKRFLFV